MVCHAITLKKRYVKPLKAILAPFRCGVPTFFGLLNAAPHSSSTCHTQVPPPVPTPVQAIERRNAKERDIAWNHPPKCEGWVWLTRLIGRRVTNRCHLHQATAPSPIGLQSYLRFDCGTGVGAMFGSGHTEPEEVRLEPGKKEGSHGSKTGDIFKKKKIKQAAQIGCLPEIR